MLDVSRRTARLIGFLIIRFDLRHIMLELRQVTILTATSGLSQDSKTRAIAQSLDNHNTALAARMDEQYQGLNQRLDALGQAVLGGHTASQASTSSLGDGEPAISNGATDDGLRILISQRAPCRSWCPCKCHAQRKAKMTMPGFAERLLGTMFVGYAGFPMLNAPCDFRGCRDPQDPAAVIEYWFPWWFVSKNMEIQFKYLPNAGPQLQLAVLRRVPDTSLSISYARQGNIDGLRYLFAQGLASPRDVSDSRGFSLVRVCFHHPIP